MKNGASKRFPMCLCIAVAEFGVSDHANHHSAQDDLRRHRSYSAE